MNGFEQTSEVSTHDFLSPVEYKVVAADKLDSAIYSVHITSKYEASFLQFLIPNQSGNTEINGTNVYLKEHWSGDLTGIVPEFALSEGARAYVNGVEQNSGVSPHDFLLPVQYKIVAADKSDSTIYTVDITTKYESEILTFSIPNQDGGTQITGTNISLKEICDGDLTGIVPGFVLSEGAKVFVNGVGQISGLTANDFNSLVEYKIIAADNSDSTIYRAYISSNCKANLLSFSIPSQVGETQYENNDIYLIQNWSGELTKVIPGFGLSDGAKAYVNGAEQISGETENNFLSNVEYEIVSADNSKTRVYTVHITTKYEATLLTFSIPNQEGETQVTGNNVSLKENWEGDLTGIVPDFTVAEGARVYINGVEQLSGVTANDFLSPVEYKIVAADNLDSTVYTVDITPFYESKLLTFLIPNQFGETHITGTSVQLQKRWGGNLSGIAAEFTLAEGARAFVNGVEQTSGENVNDFLSPVEYKIVAADKSDSTVYTVNITSKFEAMLSFSIPHQVGEARILDTDILLQQHLGYDLTGIIPEFIVAEDAQVFVNDVEQISGVTPNDFFSPVKYKVVAADNSDSTVFWVTIAPFYESQLLTFSIPDQVGQTQITGSDIHLQARWNADLTGIIPGFTLAEGAKAYVNGVEQISAVTANNFLLPVEYEVVAADKSGSNVYVVTLTLAHDIPTDITLSNNVKEENDGNLFIGELNAVSEDPTEKHIYSLEPAPNTQNDYFSIEQNNLVSNNPFDFEEQSVYTISVKADDNKGGVVQKLIEIEILDVNDPPTDIFLSKQTVKESAGVNTVIANLGAKDEDVDDIHKFSLVNEYGINGSDNSKFKVVGNNLVLLKPLNYEEQVACNIALRVSDIEGATFEKSIVLQVENVNEAPKILNTPKNYTLQDEVYVFALEASDSEGDEITVSFEGLPGWLSFNKNSNLLTGVPGNEWVGDYSFIIKASDGNLESEQQVYLTVLNVNDPPEIKNYLGVQYFYTGMENTVELPDNCIVDPDVGDELTFQLSIENNSALPNWLVFDPLTLTISGNPPREKSGIYSLKLTATDKGRLKEWLVFNLEVSSPTAVDNQKNVSTFRVFPNPVQNNLYIGVPQGNVDATIRINNIAGQVVKTLQLPSGTTTAVSMKEIEPGIYFIRMQKGELQQVQEIIKK